MGSDWERRVDLPDAENISIAFVFPDSIASLLRAQAASMLEENEKLRAQLREVGC